MGKLEETLEKFRNDASWNSPNRDGTHRFDKKIAWIEDMVRTYAVVLDMEPDAVMEIIEKERTYSWPNYYQESNFPGLDSDSVIGVFKAFEEYREYAAKNWDGFTCPKCGDITKHPQLCRHRLDNDGKCDWCASGLIRSPRGVIILENGLSLIPIFEPVSKEENAK